MRPPFRLATVLAAALLTSSACAFSSEGTPSRPAPGRSSPAPGATSAPGGGTASPTAPSGGGATLPGDLRTRPAVAAAIADTAERAQVGPDEVVIAAWSPVTWNDGSLGCPKEGMSYTQATVPGELLMLRVDSALFQYHARTGGSFAYCASPSAGWAVGG
jgi:hypothetical protein